MLLRLIFLGTSLLFIAGCGKSGEQKLDWEVSSDWISKGPVKARVQLAKKSLSVLETQYLTLEIEAELGIDFETPGLQERLEDFKQAPWRSDKNAVTENIQTLTKYFALQKFESGEQIVPPLEVRFYETSGNAQKQTSLKTPSLKFTFNALENKDMVERELAPPLGLMQLKPFDWSFWAAIAVGTLLFIFILVWAIKRVLRKEKTTPPAPPIPAHILAWRELETLVERQKQGELNAEIFVSEISNVLRRYIERRFDLRAPEQTTEEFILQLTRSGGELQTQQQVLVRFLEFTDLVKFAAKKVADEDVSKGFEFIKTFIQQTQLEAQQ